MQLHLFQQISLLLFWVHNVSGLVIDLFVQKAVERHKKNLLQLVQHGQIMEFVFKRQRRLISLVISSIHGTKLSLVDLMECIHCECRKGLLS